MRLAILAALAACSPAASNPRPASEPPPSTIALVRSMAALAGASYDGATLEARARAIDAKQLTIDALIDELVRDERFGRQVVPTLLFGSYVNIRNYYALPSSFILQRDDDSSPYFLRARCEDKDAVRVRPWWDLRATVEVCPDAYRPEKWTLAENEHGYKTKLGIACDSQIGSPEAENAPLCGCGPNLIRCLRSQDDYDRLSSELMDELRATTAYVVANEMPMASLFTRNESFRSRSVEAYYRRQNIGTSETKAVDRALADLERWPATGKWAPREDLVPGQHAGVLTSPQLLHWLPDRRQRQRAYYEVMWCTLRNTFGATTEKVLEINAAGKNFFEHESWSRLAHAPLCTNCHARLDYGFQFFSGYPDSRASVHFMRSEAKTGTGQLYGRDIDDPRGEGPLTPQGFAQLATQQPEFTSCMTDHFADYVLGDRATADDVSAIEDAVKTTGTFRAAMAVALRRFAERWRTSAESSPVVAAAAPPRGLSPELRAMLDRECMDCHDANSEGIADLRPAELPRALLVDMTDKVAFGVMPKDHVLDAPDRTRLVSLLVDHLWADPAARTEAKTYFLGRGRGLPAQQIDNVLHGHAHDWGAIERGLWTDQASITPGMIGLIGLDALRACRASGTEPLEQCLTRAVGVQTLSRWPVDP